PQSLSVGAIEPGNRIADLSSRGPVTINGSGLPAPDLVAPGVNVLSSTPGNQYGTSSGTSMASPHVAGTIALLWSAAPQLIGHLAVTEQILRASATPVADSTCGGDSDGQPNNVYGWGVVNAQRAVDTAGMLQALHGLVTDADGHPLSGAEIKISDLTWGVEIDLLTGPDGEYDTPLLPGDYRVEVHAAAHLAAWAEVTVPADMPAAYNVSLPPRVGVAYTPLISR
ncbi:MAG: peptidase S8, partial [Chloroflexi bacterium]